MIVEKVVGNGNDCAVTIIDIHSLAAGSDRSVSAGLSVCNSDRSKWPQTWTCAETALEYFKFTSTLPLLCYGGGGVLMLDSDSVIYLNKTCWAPPGSVSFGADGS